MSANGGWVLLAMIVGPVVVYVAMVAIARWRKWGAV